MEKIELFEGQVINIPVFSFYQDGGDGSHDVSFYNDMEDYVEQMVGTFFSFPSLEELEEACEEMRVNWKKAESGESPYDYGYVSPLTLKIKVQDGKFCLARSFSAGSE